MSKEDISFFSDAERNKDGRIAPEYPGWFHEAHCDDLKEKIDMAERQIERGEIPPENRTVFMSNLDRNKKIMESIERSKPNPSDVEKDKMFKAHKTMGSAISETQFSLSEMTRGTADDHEERHRMEDPCIEVQPEWGPYLSACGIDAKTKKLSRNQVARVYRIVGKGIGENTNIERLRKVK